MPYSADVGVRNIGGAAPDEPGIEPAIGRKTAEYRRFVIEYNEIRMAPCRYRADSLSKSAAATAGGVRPCAGCGRRAAEPHASLEAQALAVFGEPQLLHRIDAGVAVGTDGEAPARQEKFRCGEEAVAELRLGQWAEDDVRSARADELDLVRARVRCVHELPLGTEADFFVERLDRRAPVELLALLHFATLLADMDVHRRFVALPARKALPQGAQRFERHRAQRMRRDTQVAAF